MPSSVDASLVQDLARRLQAVEMREMERARWLGSTEKVLSDLVEAVDEVNDRVPSRKKMAGLGAGSGFSGAVVIQVLEWIITTIKTHVGGN
jgi:hypothetical protein